MKLLKSLYEIHSPSDHEGAMQEYIYNYLTNIPGVAVELDEVGNIYATKGIDETYPCCVAHMDEVHTFRSTEYRVVEHDGFILGFDYESKTQAGIGADDKNGIWVCLKLLEKYNCMKCSFFVGEEIGCVGSSNANMDFFNDCRFVLQCDRKGNSDFINCASWTNLCSEEFIKDCNIGAFGYKTEEGFLTDVQELKTRGLSVCAANISCGYYNPHTSGEVTVVKDLLRCYDLVCYIVEHCTKVYPHAYHDEYYDDYYTSYSKYDSWDEDIKGYMMEEVPYYGDFEEYCEAMNFNFGVSEDVSKEVWEEYHKTKKRPKKKKRR
jgi:putative aminopeptidase FrvX